MGSDSIHWLMVYDLQRREYGTLNAIFRAVKQHHSTMNEVLLGERIENATAGKSSLDVQNSC